MDRLQNFAFAVVLIGDINQEKNVFTAKMDVTSIAWNLGGMDAPVLGGDGVL